MASAMLPFDQILLRPIDEPLTVAAVDEPGDALAAALPAAAQTGVIAFGGAKQCAAVLYALGVWQGLRIRTLVIDNDHRPPAPVRLPSGELVQLPKAAILDLGTGYTRNQIGDHPLLATRYNGTETAPGLLRGISVYETYPVAGVGGGGYPVISALDLDLAVGDVRRAVRSFLRPFVQPAAGPNDDFYGADGPAEEAVGPAGPCRLLFLGGGCGSPGPAGHRLLPYLVRDEARRMGMVDPYQVGVVSGPHLYAGFHRRAATNWLATVTELEDLTQHGLRWEFIDGSAIDDAAPPYARIILADGERDGEKATEAEVQQFHTQLAKTLFVALTSDVLPHTEALLNDRRTPWTTVRGAQAEVDLNTAGALATLARSIGRLTTLARPAV